MFGTLTTTIRIDVSAYSLFLDISIACCSETTETRPPTTNKNTTSFDSFVSSLINYYSNITTMFFGGDPFAEHFAHGGGGGRRPGGRGRPSANVDTTKLYETLEVEKDVDAKAIKKAYRKMAIKHHPDKGGDEHHFKEVNAGK
jgi:hypothetical protein